MAKISAHGATKVATWTREDAAWPQCRMTLTLTSDGRILARTTIRSEYGNHSTGNRIAAKVPKAKLDRSLEIADRYATRLGYTRNT